MKRSDDPRDLAFDEQDPMWQLLGSAPLQEPDAWFAARTLARCRSEGQEAPVFYSRFSVAWRWVLGGGLGLCLAVGLLTAQIHSAQVDKQKNVQAAFEIMASIDNDSDSNTSSWPDSSL